MTDAAGKYVAKYRGNAGLAPGKYKVTVRKTPSAGDSKVPAEISKDPFMARLSSVAAQAEAKNETKGEFDREVAATGGTVDLELKGSATKK